MAGVRPSESFAYAFGFSQDTCVKRLGIYVLATGILMLAGFFAVVITQAQENGPTQRLSLLSRPSPAAPRSPLEGGGEAQPVSLDLPEQRMLDAHNAERTNSGLKSLQPDATLVEVARERAADMASGGYFSHEAPNGDTVLTLLEREGYAYRIASENIARNNRPDDQSVDAAMSGFLSSPVHREQVLSERYEHVGIATAKAADGFTYFVVVFSGD